MGYGDSAMKCPNCEASTLDDASFCERCGQQVGAFQSKSILLQPPPKKDKTALWIVVIVAIVAVMIVVPAVLYLMVIGFGGTSIDGPSIMYQKAAITNGQKITIVGITKFDCPWDDFRVQLSDGTNTAEWSPSSSLQISTAGHNYSESTALTGLSVCLWIYDQSGNGFVNGGDYFTLFTYDGTAGFASDTEYSAVLLWEPNGELCGQPITFTG